MGFLSSFRRRGPESGRGAPVPEQGQLPALQLVVSHEELIPDTSESIRHWYDPDEHELHADPRLMEALAARAPRGWAEQDDYFLEATHTDAFDIMSILTPGNAAAFLAHPRFKTATDVHAFLDKHGLSELVVDRADLVAEALHRGIGATELLSFALRFIIPVEEDHVAGTSVVGPPLRPPGERYMDAAELWARQMADDPDWVEENLEVRVSYATTVLEYDLDLQVLEAVGAFTPSQWEDPAALLSTVLQRLDKRSIFSHDDADPGRRAFMAFHGLSKEQRQWAFEHFDDLVSFAELCGEDCIPDTLSAALGLICDSGMPLKNALKLRYGGLSLKKITSAARRKLDYRTRREQGEALYPPLPRLRSQHDARQRLEAARRGHHGGASARALDFGSGGSGKSGRWKADAELTAIRKGRKLRTAEDGGRPDPVTRHRIARDDDLHDDELYGLWADLDGSGSGGLLVPGGLTDLDTYAVLAITSPGNAGCMFRMGVRTLREAQRLIDEWGLWYLVEDHSEVMSAAANRGVLPGPFLKFMGGHGRPAECTAGLYAEAATVWASQHAGAEHGHDEAPEAFDYGQAIIDGRLMVADLDAVGGWARIESRRDRDTILACLRDLAHGEANFGIDDLVFSLDLAIDTGAGTEDQRTVIDRLARIRTDPNFDPGDLSRCTERFGLSVLDLVEQFGTDFVHGMPGEAITREILALTAEHDPREQADAVGHFTLLASQTSPARFTPAASVAIWRAGTPVGDVLKLLKRFTAAETAALCKAMVPAQTALDMAANDLLTADQIAAVWAEGIHRSLGEGWL